jgi:hypothetical protein
MYNIYINSFWGEGDWESKRMREKKVGKKR